MMRITLALISALVLAGCSTTPPQPVAIDSLAACNWVAHPKTAAFTDKSFLCLDGSGNALPQGLPAPAIVNVWGSWCPPCRDEIPYFVRLNAEHDVTIIGVDVDEPSTIAGQRFALRSGMGWPNIFDPAGASTAIFGTGVPVTWFIDANGKVVHKKIGAIKSYDELLDLAKKYGQM
jgi:cytochrome c biogenesis protein CcmG, thiol:disulfide interchange protein DsbE